MNALVGDAGSLDNNGVNVNDPNYRQFYKITQITRPTEIFVFLDEHPDSIDDGYFVNKQATTVSTDAYTGGSTITYAEWTDLPATYHNRSTAFSFADGHASLHRWGGSVVVQPNLANAVSLPIALSQSGSSGPNDLSDFQWVMDHMSNEN